MPKKASGSALVSADGGLRVRVRRADWPSYIVVLAPRIG